MKPNFVSRFREIRHLKTSYGYKVFVASDEVLQQRNVVVKIFPPKHFQYDLAKLTKAVSWYRGLNYPYLSTILEAGLTPKKEFYYVRAYLPGPVEFSSENAALLPALLNTASFLSSTNAVHGGIKPSNLFIHDDSLKLTDPQFLPIPTKTLTKDDLPFAAPEVLMGQSPNSASDLYSVGAVIYRFFSGRNPFDDFEWEYLRAKCMWAQPKPLKDICHVPKATSDLVQHLLDKDPQNRPRALEQLLQTFTVKKVGATRAPCVGREAQIQMLQKEIAQRPETGLRIVAIGGEEGIGKSRLIEELRIRSGFTAGDFIVCDCARNGRALEPIVSGIRELLRRRVQNTSNPNIALGIFSVTLSEMFSSNDQKIYGSQAQFPPERIINDLVGYLGSLAHEIPVTIALENIDCVDEHTKQFLDQLFYRAPEVPLTVIMTRRSHKSSCVLFETASKCLRQHFTYIQLDGLDEVHSNILLRYFDHAKLSLNDILDSSAGNPLFIEEYSRFADQHARMRSTRIDLAIRRRIAEMSPLSRLAAEATALFEEPIGLEIIIALCGLDAIQMTAARIYLSAIGVTQEHESRICIKYPSLRKMLYERISRWRRINLHRVAFQLLRDMKDCSLGLQAEHALKGKLFDEAYGLYELLANADYDRGNFARATTCFERMLRCATALGKNVTLVDQFKLARCYSRIGKHSQARSIYQDLISPLNKDREPALTSSIYAELATPFHPYPPLESVRLCQQAIEILPKETQQQSLRYTQLTLALLRIGDLGGAWEAFKCAETKQRENPNPLVDLRRTRASILLNSGDFQGTVTCINSILASGYKNPVLLNNLALSLENLGDLKQAQKVQLEAQAMATQMGIVPLQIVSLGNLGSIETKLGNLREGSCFFKEALDRIERFTNRDKHFPFQSFVVAIADAALNAIHLCDYKRATKYLARIGVRCSGSFELDNITVGLIRCELALHLGQIVKAQRIIELLSQSPVFKTPYFQVERAILEARLKIRRPATIISKLKEGLQLSKQLGTVHQQCRLLNELAAASFEAGRSHDCQRYACECLEMSTNNEYKPIVARSLLLKGLSSSTKHDGSADLFRAFYMASEIGLASLASEIAFHLGALQMEMDHWNAAQEYLAKSLSFIDQILDRIPLSWRKEYVARTHRATARELLDRSFNMIQPGHLKVDSPEDSDGSKFFKATYRLAVSSEFASDVQMFRDLLIRTFEDCFSRPVVLMLETNKTKTWHAANCKITDALMETVLCANTGTGSKIHFGSRGNALLKDTVAWMPLTTNDHRGGIYVTCLPGEPPFSEKEMEFLTVVGVIANRMLDQISNRRKEEMPIERIQELHGMIGASKAIREVYSHIEIAAGNTATVLIEGESGTGKELVAKAIHQASARAKGPFIPVDCGAIPDTLIEAELFGAKKGAYTGAVADRPGLFEVADRGTIFLDEIANTTPAVQAKLLRVLQEREVRRIGETKGRTVDVRLIAATNGNLDTLSKEGLFRKDLLYRLKVLPITVPPLRQRRDDIPMLAHAFLERLNSANRTKKTFASGVTAELLTHSFPGNVRELHNAVERAFFLTKGTSINRIPLETESMPTLNNEVQSLFKELVEGRKHFWSHVHDRYKKRDIPREKVIALVDLGLKSTRGSYKNMASMFNLKGRDYRRFMDFLHRNRCWLDFRPYRQAAADPS